jgi:hypothetical protein
MERQLTAKPYGLSSQTVGRALAAAGVQYPDRREEAVGHASSELVQWSNQRHFMRRQERAQGRRSAGGARTASIFKMALD